MFYKIVKKFTKFTGKQVWWSLFSGFQPATFSKRGLWHKCLSLSFGKFLGTLFLTQHPWMTVPCVYLWILGSFSEHLFHKTPPGDCIFHAYVAGFQPANAIKTISQVLFKYFVQEQESAIQRCSLNLWKLSVKKLILSNDAGCEPAKLWK